MGKNMYMVNKHLWYAKKGAIGPNLKYLPGDAEDFQLSLALRTGDLHPEIIESWCIFVRKNKGPRAEIATQWPFVLTIRFYKEPNTVQIRKFSLISKLNLSCHKLSWSLLVLQLMTWRTICHCPLYNSPEHIWRLLSCPPSAYSSLAYTSQFFQPFFTGHAF